MEQSDGVLRGKVLQFQQKATEQGEAPADEPFALNSFADREDEPLTEILTDLTGDAGHIVHESEDADAEIAAPVIDLIGEKEFGADDEDADDTALDEESGVDDPVRMYLREIGRVRLLKGREEIDFARSMKLGDEEMNRAQSSLARHVRLAKLTLAAEPAQEQSGLSTVDHARRERAQKSIKRGARPWARVLEVDEQTIEQIVVRLACTLKDNSETTGKPLRRLAETMRLGQRKIEIALDEAFYLIKGNDETARRCLVQLAEETGLPATTAEALIDRLRAALEIEELPRDSDALVMPDEDDEDDDEDEDAAAPAQAEDLATTSELEPETADPDASLLDLSGPMNEDEDEAFPWRVTLDGEDTARSAPVRELIRLLRLGEREADQIWVERTRPGVTDDHLAQQLATLADISDDEAEYILQK